MDNRQEKIVELSGKLAQLRAECARKLAQLERALVYKEWAKLAQSVAETERELMGITAGANGQTGGSRRGLITRVRRLLAATPTHAFSVEEVARNLHADSKLVTLALLRLVANGDAIKSKRTSRYTHRERHPTVAKVLDAVKS